MTYTRVLIWITDAGFVVFGYTGARGGEFRKLQTFDSIGEAAEFAITLPVKNPDHPINIVRRTAA